MRRLVLRWIGGATVLVAIWFLAVDWSWFVERCDDCLMDRDVYQYRLASIPISSQIHASGGNLNPRCRHPNLKRWQKHRWWGLLICCCPCQNGVYRLSEHVDRSPSLRG